MKFFEKYLNRPNILILASTTLGFILSQWLG